MRHRPPYGLVFNFLLCILSAAGAPITTPLALVAERRWPGLTSWLQEPWVQWLSAVVVALLVLYAIGVVSSRVIGAPLFGCSSGSLGESRWWTRFTVRQKSWSTCYARNRKAPARGVPRFPRDGLKTLVFVMRTFADAQTGEGLAAVYVPSALNPTSGFMEIVSVAKLIASDVPADQTMAMIIYSGAVMPESFSLSPPKDCGLLNRIR